MFVELHFFFFLIFSFILFCVYSFSSASLQSSAWSGLILGPISLWHAQDGSVASPDHRNSSASRASAFPIRHIGDKKKGLFRGSSFTATRRNSQKSVDSTPEVETTSMQLLPNKSFDKKRSMSYSGTGFGHSNASGVMVNDSISHHIKDERLLRISQESDISLSFDDRGNDTIVKRGGGGGARGFSRESSLDRIPSKPQPPPSHGDDHNDLWSTSENFSTPMKQPTVASKQQAVKQPASKADYSKKPTVAVNVFKEATIEEGDDNTSLGSKF
jgi:hypothetical protein